MLTKEQARTRLRRIFPYRTLEGEERATILTLLMLTHPVSSFNDQRSWTDVYYLGDRKYHVTYFSPTEIDITEVLETESPTEESNGLG